MKLLVFQCPSECSLVRQVLEALKRLFKGKQSLDLDEITKVAEKFNSPQASLFYLRTCFIFIIAFDGIRHSL